MHKVVELPHAQEDQFATEVEELEVLLSVLRACHTAAALLRKPENKAALQNAIQAVMVALSVSGIVDG